MKAEKQASAALQKINKIAAVSVLLCSLLLFLDYLMPGSLERATLKEYEVNSVRGRGSSATTYNIISEKYSFPIDEEFLAISNVGDTLKLEVSRVLKIINAYGLQNQKEYYTYYTRYLNGVVFPLALLLSSLFALRLKYTAENITYMFLAINTLALFFTFMTIINVSNIL
jgi:hypothetical protein